MPENTNSLQEKHISSTGLTVTESARRLSVSQSHFWKMIREGKIRVVRLGGRTIVPQGEIVRVLSGMTS